MKAKKTWKIVGLFISILMVSGCGNNPTTSITTNHEPAINVLIATPAIVVINGISVLTCEATDQDGDSLSYSWSCALGTLSCTSETTTKWTAPSTVGAYTVNVKVGDGKTNTISSLNIIVVATSSETTPSWETVGSVGFSAGQVSHPSLYVYNGTPYVAFQDGGNSNKATVMKFNGSSWGTVGSAGFSTIEAQYTSLYVYNGTPYVAYRDRVKATVMKYNGTVWETVGSAGFSSGEADNLSLYVDNDTPYVAYQDVRNSNKATVMKYNGFGWETVGSVGFSAGQASFPSLYIYNGTPYIAYQDGGNSNKATVMKYIVRQPYQGNSAWETVGSAGFSVGTAQFTSLYVYNGTPYIAFQDGGNANKATVMKYNGSGWETVGSAGFSSGAPYSSESLFTSLYVYNGTPYVAFEDWGYSTKATVMKYEDGNSTWQTVGSAGFSSSEAQFLSLYVYNGTPYVAYQDEGNNGKVTVMKYGP